MHLIGTARNELKTPEQVRTFYEKYLDWLKGHNASNPAHVASANLKFMISGGLVFNKDGNGFTPESVETANLWHNSIPEAWAEDTSDITDQGREMMGPRTKFEREMAGRRAAERQIEEIERANQAKRRKHKDA